MNGREIFELLQRLGLTEYESKTLTSLIKLNEAKAPDVSREAQVPKTRVYDVLDKLVERDLIIEIQGRPKKYRVRETDRVFNELLNRKKSELKTLESETLELQQRLGREFKEEQAGEKVLKVKDRQDFVRILAQEIQKANNSVIAFTEETPKHSAMLKAINEARQRNVKVKVLHGLPEEELGELSRAGVEVKKAQHSIEAFIIDDKKLVLALSDLKKEKPEYHFTIWVEAPIIPMLKSHFDRNWGGKK